MTTPPNPHWPAEPNRDPATTSAHGYPPRYPDYPMPGPTNGFAIASLVLGILWIWWFGSILALIFGYVARKQIRERNETGDGLAIAGIVLGWVGVGVLALFLILLAIGLATGPA
jgi:Domain of unknown function (DUF4190)